MLPSLESPVCLMAELHLGWLSTEILASAGSATSRSHTKVLPIWLPRARVVWRTSMLKRTNLGKRERANEKWTALGFPVHLSFFKKYLHENVVLPGFPV